MILAGRSLGVAVEARISGPCEARGTRLGVENVRSAGGRLWAGCDSVTHRDVGRGDCIDAAEAPTEEIEAGIKTASLK
jgi:hypothetical protein